MKKIISLILLFAMISSSCALAEVNESDSSLLFSFKYSDDGIIYDECENAEIELQEDTVKEHPSVYNVDTLISEAGDTKIFSSNYLQLKVSGERVNELVNSIDVYIFA